MLGEVKQYDVKSIAERHGVDAGKLNTLINWFHLNEQMPTTATKRKLYADIDKAANKLMVLLESAERYEREDVLLDILRENYIQKIRLPDTRKGPNKSNRDTLIYQLADMYPGKISVSRHSDGTPHSPFLNFCHDVMVIADPSTTIEAIAKVTCQIPKIISSISQ